MRAGTGQRTEQRVGLPSSGQPGDGTAPPSEAEAPGGGGTLLHPRQQPRPIPWGVVFVNQLGSGVTRCDRGSEGLRALWFHLSLLLMEKEHVFQKCYSSKTWEGKRCQREEHKEGGSACRVLELLLFRLSQFCFASKFILQYKVKPSDPSPQS